MSSTKLFALMTVYNEGEYIEYAIQSCLPFVDRLVIVEGAYQQTIKLGSSPRSKDETIKIIEKYKTENPVKIIHVEANELSDPEQRNVGLKEIKKLCKDTDSNWMLIIDGDEIYEPQTFKLIRSTCCNMYKSDKYACYFTSQTFVNDFDHYCVQSFPRLFRITSKCNFINDNYLYWPDHGVIWTEPYIINLPQIKFYHYSFCKGLDRFRLKKNWWQTRFDSNYKYSWNLDSDGNIYDNNHRVCYFTGKHPDIMKTHPKYKNRI